MIVGIDEVGRGCWAGPLVAGAVILRRPIDGLNDSKLLTRRQREDLNKQILAEALAVGLGWVEAREIDTVGIVRAVGLAMERALARITMTFDELVIDGNHNFFPFDPRAKAIIKADSKVPAVSAASIVAKVARDRWMRSQAARDYPAYGFNKHVGYGTKLHQETLRLHGVCALHRRSFKPMRLLPDMPERVG